jgi:hypothetical protein
MRNYRLANPFASLDRTQEVGGSNELTQENGFRLYLNLRYELLGHLPPRFRRVRSLYF